MKNIFLILFFALFSGFAIAQSDNSQVVNALKSGNSDAVAEHFDKIIDIKFPDKDEVKSIGKNQAGIALKSFYDGSDINGFELSSQREMSGTMYIAGKLLNKGEGYKLSMMLKVKDSKYQIITVRIN